MMNPPIAVVLLLPPTALTVYEAAPSSPSPVASKFVDSSTSSNSAAPVLEAVAVPISVVPIRNETVSPESNPLGGDPDVSYASVSEVDSLNNA